MSNRLTRYFRQSAGYVWLIPVAAYLTFSASQAVFHNYSSQQQTLQLKKELAASELERDRLEALVVYYHTDNYKEKELRRALLLVRPEERVYALPEASVVRDLESEALVKRSAEKTPKSALPFWRQWLDYLI